ncbi:PREDICTED: TNF receptor-associated factor 2-like [Branchiostoma belcheri]|uniref:TNF receptor-associated factor 2-like n=1 Tax=Branchiostoma belcheri TaxID=7741 RepID=A0A6P4YQ05_BRABE|nr:PREDICTED: TNF receptor-associated factor 2-like [Branchiostoma belcheri]XP_019619280.1 PREDICTED: TNF receptor-associated factor 2-like [Branchiostoma belcheri]XP_019619281.1 PREDICTED: TNF receptor-associated factor 2-like [Branchiostoma belcheri]
MPGFPDKIFKSSNLQKFRCPICQQVLRDPVQTECGHRYCSSCIGGFLNTSAGPRCLVCPTEECPFLDKDKMNKDRFAQREIENMEVKCPTTGCDWEGILGQYLQIHKHHCPATSDERSPPPAPTQAAGVSRQDQTTRRQTFPDDADSFTLTTNQHLMGPLREACAPPPPTPVEDRASSASNDEKNRVVRLQGQVAKMRKETRDLVNAGERLDTRMHALGEGLTSSLRATERLSVQREAYERQHRQDREIIETLERKVRSLERIIALKDVALAEQDLRIQTLELTSYDGILTWKIPDFTRKRHDAITGKTASFYSPCFFTSRTGYKMGARIYLNGDGMGKGSHISLFFVLMRGHFDGLLRWPFKQKVTFMLLDQNNREHEIDAFRPDPTSSSFQRPTSDMNIASGCPLFVPLSQLESSSHAYVRDDTMYLRVIVDTSDLN